MENIRNYIEQTFKLKYEPYQVRPLFQKNTKTKKYFLYRPYFNAFIQQEFVFDVILNEFMIEYGNTLP